MLAIIEHGASLHTRSDGPDYVGITVESILGHRCVDFGSSPPQHRSSPLYKKVESTTSLQSITNYMPYVYKD